MESKEVTVDLNAKNIEKIKALVNQKNVVEQLLNECITTIIDTKEVYYEADKVTIAISEDFSKIIISDREDNEVVQK